jgi:hypothetical protein
MKGTELMKTDYANAVKSRMVKKLPSAKLGGAFLGKPRSHICLELKDNFIDGIYPEKKCLLGSLTDKPIKYHYAEHLNSSQTMCISFFKKFFETECNRDRLIKILALLGINLGESAKITDAVFEYIPEVSVPDFNEGTNFDFYLKMEDGTQLTWEIKFTESEFGKTTKDEKRKDRYIEKYEKYKEMLAKSIYKTVPVSICDTYDCLSSGALTKGCPRSDVCPTYEFYRFYQIRRNLLYATGKNDYTLFLSPRENESLNEDREYIDAFAEKYRTDRIKNLYWEDLIKATLSVVSDNRDLYDYYTKFKIKYFES